MTPLDILRRLFEEVPLPRGKALRIHPLGDKPNWTAVGSREPFLAPELEIRLAAAVTALQKRVPFIDWSTTPRESPDGSVSRFHSELQATPPD